MSYQSECAPNRPPIKEESLSEVIAFIRDTEVVFEKQADRQLIEEATWLMCEVHADQAPRSDGRPYVEHPLEVARTVLWSLEKPDTTSIIAALLHDSVEDQADKLAEKLDGHLPLTDSKPRAIMYLHNRFGPEVAETVNSLSNPDFETELAALGLEYSKNAKNTLYIQHVTEAIENTRVLAIKLADYSRNGFMLDEVLDKERRLNLSAKYLPLNRVFINKLQSNEPDGLSSHARINYLRKLYQVEASMQRRLVQAGQLVL